MDEFFLFNIFNKLSGTGTRFSLPLDLSDHQTQEGHGHGKEFRLLNDTPRPIAMSLDKELVNNITDLRVPPGPNSNVKDELSNFTDTQYKFDQFEDSSSLSPNELTVNTYNDMGALQVFERQVPSHLLMVSLLEHICTLYENSQEKSKKLFHVLCNQLSGMKLMPNFTLLEEFQTIRDKYKTALDDLMKLAMEKVNPQDILQHERILGRRNFSQSGSTRYNIYGEPRIFKTPSRYNEEFGELHELGRGGFGAVYRVRNKLDGRDYAVKKVKLVESHPDNSLKILREVKVLANLTHSNIVRYHSAWLEYGINDRCSEGQFHRTSTHPAKLCALELEDDSFNKERIFPPTFPTQESVSHSISFRDNESSGGKIPTRKAVFSVADEDSVTEDTSDLSMASVAKRKSETDLEVTNKVCPPQCSKPECEADRGSFGCQFGNFSSSNRNKHLIPYNPSLNSSNVGFRRAISAESLGKYQEYVRDDCDCGKDLSRKSRRQRKDRRVTFMHLGVTMYIQMELCTATLKEWLIDRNKQTRTAENSIDWHSNMDIFKQLLNGVDYIHSNGLMHRDIKPRNIFVNSKPQHRLDVKIGDFGLARDDVKGKKSRRNSSSEFVSHLEPLTPMFPATDDPMEFPPTAGVGTCTYAAPEQLANRNYTAKADIYSLGIVLFELFSPFKTEMERIMSIKQIRKGELPEELQRAWKDESQLIADMTRQHPEERPAASEMLEFRVFQDKDRIISMLQQELARKNSVIQKLQEELRQKDFELERFKHERVSSES